MSGLLSDSGLDTVRFRWREDSNVYELFGRRKEGYQMGYRGEKFVQTQLGRIGVFPDGLTYLEGRSAAVASWNRDNHDLHPPDQLHSAELAARAWVQENGAALGEVPARLGRIDLASELRFSSSEEGSAFLHSLAGLDVPWCKSRVDGRKGEHIETVSFHGTRGKTIYLRAYDKGVESHSDRAGVRIRVERQKRYRKDREPLASELDVADLRRAYWGREFEKLADLPSATIADLRGCLSSIYERATSWNQAYRLAGYTVLGGLMGDEMPMDAQYRFRSELRSLGIFHDPAQVERLEVPVGQYLQTLGAAWAVA
jgi:hypothetical protein